MMTVDSPEFNDLLCEALRAGPQSPEWHQAIALLRDAGVQADGYRALIRAREHLESGREFRAVRPGPAFGRRIMDAVASADAPRSANPTTIIAIIAATVMLLAVGVLFWWIFPRAGAQPAGVQELKRIVFVDALADARFDDALPAGWKTLGQLPLIFDHGLYAHPTPDQPILGGAVVATQAFADDLPLAIDVRLVCPDPVPAMLVQVFVTDQPVFSADRAMTNHELAWMLRADQMQVMLPDGHVAAQHPFVFIAGPRTVRLALNRDAALVSVDGQVIWSGEHQLLPHRPRFVGVRFLSTGEAGNPSTLRIRSVRIARPAP